MMFSGLARILVLARTLLAVAAALSVIFVLSPSVAAQDDGQEVGESDGEVDGEDDSGEGDDTAEGEGADPADPADPADADSADAGQEAGGTVGGGSAGDGRERVFTAPIPAPPAADSESADEYEAYRAAAERYYREVSEYRRELNAVVRADYDEKLSAIDRVYQTQIEELRREERSYRDEAIVRLEGFLAKHPDNKKYAPGVLYRLAVLHYEKADDEYYSADPATLTAEYPDFSRSIYYSSEVIRRFPEFPQLDGAYYLLGFCNQKMERREEAKVAFQTLVERYPDSPKAPEALTRIGEYYFARSQESIQGFGGEVQWDKSNEYYGRAVEYGPDYAIYDRALYRLAWTEYYMEDYDSMIFRFIELVEYADRVPQGSALRQEAIEFMAAALAEDDWNLQDDISRDPDFGMERFDRYLNEGRPFELEVLRVYADTLMNNARYEFAAEAYQALLDRDVCNPENPKIAQALAGAYNLNDEPDKATAVQSQLEKNYGKDSEWYKCQEQEGNLEALAYAESISRRALKVSISTYHTQSNELAAELDQAYQELESAPEGDRSAQEAKVAALEIQTKESFAKTADVTNDFINRFPNDQEVYLFRYILADAYYSSGQYDKAAPAFEDARDVSDGRFRRDAANGAVDSRRIIIEQDVVSRGGDPRGLPPSTIKEGYLGGQIPAEKVPTYLLREVVKEGGGGAEAESEIASREGEKPSPEAIPGDVQELIAARDKYIEYGLDERRGSDEEPLEDDYKYLNAVTYYHYGDYEKARVGFRDVIENHPETEFAVVSAGFLINTYESEGDLEKVAEVSRELREKDLGSGESKAALDAQLENIENSALFEKANRLFENEEYAEAAYEFERIANENPDFDRIHLALYNAGVAYERIQRYESAMRLYKRVYTEYNETEEAADALYRVGFNGERFFDFDAAVDSYLELHDTKRESFQNHPKRTESLKKAAVILKYTERHARAAELMERYHDEHNEQADAPDLLFEAALMHQAAGNDAKMGSTFDKFRDRYDNAPDQRIQILRSYVIQGDSYKSRGDEKRAIAFYQKALSLYRQGGGSAEANAQAAQAQFQIADIEFLDWSKISLESSSLTSWKGRLEKKKAGTAPVAEKFRAVWEYKSPEWTMASSYRIASMFHNFGNTLEEAQCPTSVDEDTCDGIREGLLEGSFDLKNKAKAEYETVVQFGKTNNVVNEWTRRSLNGLNDLAPKEYPMFEGERTALEARTTTATGLVRASDVEEESSDREAPKDLEEK